MDNLKTFVSKKLIAFIVVFVTLICVGEVEAAKQVAFAYIGAQGAVDVARNIKRKIS